MGWKRKEERNKKPYKATHISTNQVCSDARPAPLANGGATCRVSLYRKSGWKKRRR